MGPSTSVNEVAPIRRVAFLMVGVLVLEAAFAISYVGGLHDPRPHRVPVVVVGPAIAFAQVERAAEAAAPGALEISSAADEARARAAIGRRSAYGAYVFGTSTDRLLVASAAGPAVAQLLRDQASRIAATAGRPLEVVDVRPLPTSDSRGLSSFYLVVSWVVGGYLVATIVGLSRGMAGRSRRLATARLGALVGFALASGIVTATAIGPVMGVLHGHGPVLALEGALVVFAVATFTTAIESLAGIAGTGLAILLFVVLGNPSSGGPFPPELLPGFWRSIGMAIPPGAGTALVRNTMYFGGHATAPALLVLSTYGVVGVLGTLFLAGRHRPLDPVEGEVGEPTSGGSA